MALIKCPECGQEVSDKAAQCPRCAYPIVSIQSANVTKIKLPPYNDQTGPLSKIRIVDVNTEQELAIGGNDAIIDLHISKPTTICLRWGQLKSLWKNSTFTVSPNKKYMLTWTPGFLMAKLVCNEVDSFAGFNY